MDDSSKHVLLVTPVWNDSARMARFGPELAAVLKEKDWPVRWVVADDGSSQEEVARLDGLVEAFREIYPAVGLMRNVVRSRKGGAIRQVWDAIPEAEWLAFVDADGAISATDTARLLQHALTGPSGKSTVAIRRHSAETPVERPFFRELSFRIFTILVRSMLHVSFSDSQCGAKVIPGSAYRKVRPLLRETGFAFDAELLLALQVNGNELDEVPVAWSEQDGGKVHPLRDAWGMLLALFRIRRRHRAGHYRI